jgi:hypothetical protein
MYQGPQNSSDRTEKQRTAENRGHFVVETGNEDTSKGVPSSLLFGICTHNSQPHSLASFLLAYQAAIPVFKVAINLTLASQSLQ